LHELESYGCEVVTLADGFDLSGPARDVCVAVMAWAAQMEREALGERISAARARVEAEGGSWGRPRRADYEAKAERARVLFHRKGRSIREIAVALKVPRTTIGRWVTQKPTPPTELPAPAKVSQK